MADCSCVRVLVRRVHLPHIERAMTVEHSKEVEGEGNAEWGVYEWEAVSAIWDLVYCGLSLVSVPYVLWATGHYAYPGVLCASDGEVFHYAEALDLGDGPVVPVARVMADGSIDQRDHENCVLPMMRAAYKIQQEAGLRWLEGVRWPEDEEEVSKEGDSSSEED